MSQQKRLDEYPLNDLIWATVQYDELLQTVFQNIILIEKGYWVTHLKDSSDATAKRYFKRKEELIKCGIVDETRLRLQVLNRLTK